MDPLPRSCTEKEQFEIRHNRENECVCSFNYRNSSRMRC